MRILNYLIVILLISTTSYASPIGGGPIGGGTSGGGSGDITSVGSCTSGDCTNAFINDTAIDLTSLTLNDLIFDVGSVSKTEFGYLNGVTSNIQSQINALGGGSGAPIDAQYWTTAANGTLTGEVIVNSPASLETAASLGAFFSEYADDTDAATMRATLGLVIGTNVLAPNGDGSSLINVDATTGDSATAFFDAGTVETNYGGTGTDLSSTTGIMGMNAGTYVDVDTPDELETYAGLGAYASDILSCTGLPGLMTLVNGGDYTPTGTVDLTTASSVALGPIDAGDGTLEVPNGTSDAALSNAGEIYLNVTDDQLAFHAGASGEAQGEVAISLLQHKTWSFDPKAVCDGAVDRLFLMKVGDDATEGIVIVEWSLSFEADPTTEIDADLEYADAYIGWANATVIDILDTTSGVSSEDTNANINGGAAIANGKVLGIDFGTAYTETTHQIIFEMWYYAEED